MTRNQESEVVKRPNLKKKEHNKTTLFMLPAVNLNKEKVGYKLLTYFGLVNCYISHKQSVESYSESTVSMVFNPDSDAIKRFKDFYEIYRNYPNYVDDYCVDSNVIIVVFKVKDKWENSYTEFRNSKYSKMSKEYADLFKRPDIASGKTVIDKQYHIINKSKELRLHMEQELGVRIHEGWELMDPLNMTREVFDYVPIFDKTDEELDDQGYSVTNKELIS